jgi:hypothetical protein
MDWLAELVQTRIKDNTFLLFHNWMALDADPMKRVITRSPLILGSPETFGNFPLGKIHRLHFAEPVGLFGSWAPDPSKSSGSVWDVGPNSLLVLQDRTQRPTETDPP